MYWQELNTALTAHKNDLRKELLEMHKVHTSIAKEFTETIQKLTAEAAEKDTKIAKLESIIQSLKKVLEQAWTTNSLNININTLVSSKWNK